MARHGKDAEAQREIKQKQAECQKRKLYAPRKIFAGQMSDTSGFIGQAVEDHLQKKPGLKHREAWIEITEPMVTRCLYDQRRNQSRSQRIIDEYFRVEQ